MDTTKAAPVGREYAGPSGIGRDSIWLTAEDLVEGKDVSAEIAAVLLYPEVTFEAGRKKTNVIGVKFVGKERILLLNATNRKSLNKMFGNITKLWKGQSITLYVAEVQFGGETVKAVRIRNQRSRAASAAEDFIAGNDEPVAGAGVAGAAPAAVGAELARLTDDQAYYAFAALADRATKSFGGERAFLKEAPKKSGQWYVGDGEITGTPGQSIKIYDGTAERLTVSREDLAQYTAKLEALLA